MNTTDMVRTEPDNYILCMSKVKSNLFIYLWYEKVYTAHSVYTHSAENMKNMFLPTLQRLILL